MENKTILVSGADGFLGSHAVRMALAEGHNVVALVHAHGDKPERKLARLHRMKGAHERLQIISGDVTDAHCMKELFHKHPAIDAVIHTAAMMIVPNTEDGKAKAQRVNAFGTRLLASAANQCAREQKKIITFHYISSVHVLSQHSGIESGAKSLGGYATSKLGGEKELDGLKHLFSVITYPPYLFGPDQEKPLLIPTLVRKALKGEKMPIVTGGAKMDYLHVDNFVSDLLSSLQVAPRHAGQVRYAIEGDMKVSVEDVAHLVCDTMNDTVRDSRITNFRDQLQRMPATAKPAEATAHSLPYLRGKREPHSLRQAVEEQVYHLLPEAHPML